MSAQKTSQAFSLLLWGGFLQMRANLSPSPVLSSSICGKKKLLAISVICRFLSIQTPMNCVKKQKNNSMTSTELVSAPFPRRLLKLPEMLPGAQFETEQLPVCFGTMIDSRSWVWGHLGARTDMSNPPSDDLNAKHFCYLLILGKTFGIELFFFFFFVSVTSWRHSAFHWRCHAGLLLSTCSGFFR